MSKGKDKPILQTTMQDVAIARYPDENSKKMFFMNELGGSKMEDVNPIITEYQESQKHWEDNELMIKEYNEKLKELDEEYKRFIPTSGILVRCYHLEAKKSDSGIIIPLEIPMAEMTQNGIGVRKTYSSPWPLSRKAVVVSVPENVTFLKPGDVVELNRRCVLAEKRSVDHPAHLAYGFTLSDWYDFEPPINPSDKHFGYLMVHPINDIVGKVS